MNTFNIYVYENRSMNNDLSRPLMLENLNVDNAQIHIPKEIDGTDMGTWAWWFVYQNAKREKYSIPMTLEGVTNDEGEEEYISTVGLNHGFTGKHGSVMYAIEAVQADGSGAVTHEWHTRTYKLEIVTTLQANQTEYRDTESDIISALISRVNELITSGAEIAEIAETIESAAETAQEVIDSIPSDYSELSNRVGTNTIALAEKADRATTYTKTEVDRMIEGVEVETDTTLEVSGAPADAAETGRQIGLLKADLDTVANAMFVDVSWSDLGLTWEQGGYNANNGTRGTASATSIRCPNIPKSVFSKIEKIRCAEGYKLTLLGYDSNGYLGFWKNGTAFAKSSLSSGIWYDELDITQFADLEYISLRSNRSDGANVVPADASNVIPTMRSNDSSFIIDNTLTDADKAAGALETGTRIEAIKTDIYKSYPLGQVGGVTFGNAMIKLNDGTRNNSIKYVLYSNYIPKFIKELHVSSEGLTAGYFMRLYAYDDGVYQGCWSGSSFIKSGTPADLTDIVFANFAEHDYKIIVHCGSVYGSDETAPLTEANKVSALCIDYKVPEDVTISPADYQGREICTFNKILCIGDSLMTGSTNHPTGITPNPENAKRTVVNSMYSIPTFLTKMYGVETTAWGISGATTRSWYNSKSSDDWSGYDAAIVRLGNNDYTYGTSDDVDYDGAAAISDQYMKLIIAKLKADNPGIRIFLSTLSVSNLTDRLSAWRIPLMEKYRQIAADDESVFLVDTAIYANYRASGGYYSGHPTALGYQLMAQDYGSIISYIMHNNPDSFKWIQTVGTAYAVTDYSEAGDEEDVG